MPIVPQTTMSPRVVGKTMSGDKVAFGPGTKVSLNLSRRLFLATPHKEFCLSEKNPTCTIPYDVSEGVLQALKSALDREDIVIGHQPVPRAMRKGLLEPVYEEIDKATSVDQIKPTIFSIASGRMRLDRHPPSELIRRLALHEAEHGCRQEFMDFFGGILERIPGPGGVEEHPQDAISTRVRTSDSGSGGGAATQPSARNPEQQRAMKDLI